MHVDSGATSDAADGQVDVRFAHNRPLRGAAALSIETKIRGYRFDWRIVMYALHSERATAARDFVREQLVVPLTDALNAQERLMYVCLYIFLSTTLTESLSHKCGFVAAC